MKKAKGFRLGRRLVRSEGCATRAVSKLSKCLQFMKQGAKRLYFGKANSGYFRVGQEPKNVSVPKGHLAVYVGEKEDDMCRVVVPVIYFNHPLFAELLEEAEMAYGYNHPGGIKIPCRISEFENVKSRIAATLVVEAAVESGAAGTSITNLFLRCRLIQ